MSAMSMRSDRSSVVSSDSDEEKEWVDVERRHLEDEGIIGDSGNINPASIVGYIWEGERAILDDMAPYHFVRRGEVDVSDIADHVQSLSSDMFNWCTMGYLMTDIFSKSRIEGDKRDFMYFMYRLASLANTMGDENVGRILEQMAGSDHLLHRANQKLDENKAMMGDLRDKIRAGEIQLGGANKLIAKLQGEREQHKAETEEMNREGNRVMTMLKERMAVVDVEVAVREDERLADKAKLEALNKEIAQLWAKLVGVTERREENVEMAVDKVNVTSEEDKIKAMSSQDTVLVPATPETVPMEAEMEAEMEEVAVTEMGRDEALRRGCRRLPGNMRGGESRNRSRSASKMGQKPTLDFDPNELLTQTMSAILKVPGMSVTDAFVAATNVVEAKSKEMRHAKEGNAKSKPKPTSFAEAARQGPAFDPETVLG